MFGPRITTVFRSRWRAVWFVLSVLAGVYWSVPRQGAQDDADERKAAEAVAAVIQQQQPNQTAPAEHHLNPWAKTPQ
jgi:hypothetical protein